MIELDRLVGLPSGQLIEVTQKELNFLINLEFTEWNSKYNEFIFNDNLVDDIYHILKRINIKDNIKTTSGKKGIVIGIVKNYNGKDTINNINVSSIYKKGDKLYVIEFQNGKKGIYLNNQIEKIRPNSIFENYGSFIDDELSIIEIVGLPSGQIIEAQDNEIDYLKRHQIIKWNGSRQGVDDYIGYTFDDEDYKTIMKLLYQLFQ